MKEIILGGVCSGKSALALRYAQATGLGLVLIVTASADDPEMTERIRRHQAERDGRWRVVEERVALAAALRAEATAQRCIVVDCLTLWLSNLLCASYDGERYLGDSSAFARERAALLEALPSLPGQVILVGNEVGMGIVPMGALSRRFRDESGRLHQELAHLCDRVTLTVAGLAHRLKGEAP